MLTTEEKEVWIRRYYPFCESYMKMALADRNKIPQLEIRLDEGSYTDHSIIHIGIGGLEENDEESLLRSVLFLIGHEVQHVRSTSQRAWMYGMNRGFQVILEEYAGKTESKRKVFRKEADYEVYIKELAAKGFHISTNSLQQFVHFIANSLEDGRIERIRCVKRPGFKDYMVAFRGRDWKKNEVDPSFGQNLDNPRVYLALVLNQVLNLATMSIYQKGFTKVCPIDSRPQVLTYSLMPDISAGIASANCRGCMEHAISICKKLAVEILEASKLTPLEELLSDILSAVFEECGISSFEGTDSRNEETSFDSPGNPFGKSDLKAKPEISSQHGDENAFGQTGEQPEDDAASQNDMDSLTKEDAYMDSLVNAAKASSDTEVADAMKSAYIEERLSRKQRDDSSKRKEKKNEDVLPDLEEVDSFYDKKVTLEEEIRTYPADMRMPFELKGQANVLKRKIEKVFHNMQKPVLRGRRAGQLDAAMAYKLAMNQMDCFMKKGEVSEFDGCAYFLADNSGSMGGKRRENCCKALAKIEYAFQDIMPLKIVAFNASSNWSVTHQVLKNWSEKVNCNGSYNFLTHRKAGGGNKDGYSIRVATEELLRQSERKKILIVLSDGLPSAYRGSEGNKDVKDAVIKARKAGISVISIFFGDESDQEEFVKMYEKNCIVTKPEGIDAELVRLMKRFCFR